MKTTIKLTKTKAVHVMPMSRLDCLLIETPDDVFTLTRDQAVVLIFGIEQALAILDVQRANYGEVAA